MNKSIIFLSQSMKTLWRTIQGSVSKSYAMRMVMVVNTFPLSKKEYIYIHRGSNLSSRFDPLLITESKFTSCGLQTTSQCSAPNM